MRSRWSVLVLGVGLLACSSPMPRGAATLANRPGDVAPRRSCVPRGPVTEEAMTCYFRGRFPAAVATGTLRLDYGSANVAEQIVQELAALGIRDVRGLDALVPYDLEPRGFRALAATGDPSTNVAGLMRDLMIMYDTRRYFTKAWNHSWSTSGPEDFPIPRAYGVDFDVMRELGVFDDDDE